MADLRSREDRCPARPPGSQAAVGGPRLERTIYNPAVPRTDPFNATTEGLDDGRRRRERIATVRFVFRGSAGVVHEPAKVLRKGVTRLGRIRADDAIPLEHDGLASREHAVLRSSPATGELVIEDRGSRNGVRVNGRPVTQQELADGDVVRLGGSFMVVRLEDPTQRDVPVADVRGSSPAMQRARMAIRLFASESASVLILGETGTGKEVVARALHDESGRSGRFVAVNCSAISESLAESELFGHVAGAFTGAVQDRDGYFRAAHGGTLLLDEIGDMPKTLQPKLLRALEQKRVTPVGSTRAVDVDVRVLAATHVDVAARSEEGGFRADLLARLAQLRIQLPPLCERPEDILALLEPHLRDAPPLAPDLVDALLNARWANNVRELIGVATELRVWGKDRDVLDLRLLEERSGRPLVPREIATPPDVTSPLELGRSELAALLQEHGGNVAAVAKAVKRSRTQVYRWIEKHELDLDRFRPDD